MTRTYAGPFRNPTEGFFIKPNVCKFHLKNPLHYDHDGCDCGSRYEIWVRSDRQKDGSCEPDRKHTSAPTFDDHSDALDWINDLHEHFEEDYDQYLDENHADIARMEAYEDYRNEY